MQGPVPPAIIEKWQTQFVRRAWAENTPNVSLHSKIKSRRKKTYVQANKTSQIVLKTNVDLYVKGRGGGTEK